MPKRAIPAILVIFLTLTFSSCTCIYFNTFHNIRKAFNSAEESRQKENRETAKGGEVQNYNIAITKASKVLERHPNSGYVDDALYIIGTSYYYLGEFDKSARKFKELFVNYPGSEYVRSSRLMFAKAKMQLKEETEAIVIFEEILKNETDRGMKATAARALGQFNFDTKQYEQANVYFQALIDSLGDQADKLHAYIYMADGYFDLFQFRRARDHYVLAKDNSPDSLQNYRIMIRVAECDYFLNDVSAGLEKLQELAADELYYDSLGAIRLMMAEGYEREGDFDAAVAAYEKIIVENPGKDAAAIAYYYLGLIYQYDFENLILARNYYSKAREEKKGSPVYEDATRRASTLSLLEDYKRGRADTLQVDSTHQPDQKEIDHISENNYLLGELFYFDLEKPDSALAILSSLVQDYPNSRYTPRALMTMAHIYQYDLGDTASADSLLRLVLQRYPKSDEVEPVIDLLGLSGTRADAGYAALTFKRGESFFQRFLELDSTWYYLKRAADSALAVEMQRTDSTGAADSAKSDQEKSTPAADSTPVAAEPAKPTPIPSPAYDSVLVVDTTWKPDSVWTMDSSWTPDSVWVIDSALAPDSTYRLDSALTMKPTLRIDSSFVIDTVMIIDSNWTVTAVAPPSDSMTLADHWRLSRKSAARRYQPAQMRLLDSAYYYYQQVVDSFPLSEYSVQARFVLLHMYDRYLSPGDSSLIDLYGAFVDSFPESPYSELISEQYNIRPLKSPKRSATPGAAAGSTEEKPSELDDEMPGAAGQTDSLKQPSAESKLITDEGGNTLPPANEYFLNEIVKFEYPLEAVAYNIQDKLYFQIRIDFSGEVAEVKLMNPTESDELNDRIIRTVENTRFDSARIPPEMYDHWFYYTYTVVMPEQYRQ